MQLRTISTPRSFECSPTSTVSALSHLRMLFLCVETGLFPGPVKIQRSRDSLSQPDLQKELQCPTSASTKRTQDEDVEILKLFTALEQFLLHILD